MFYTKERSSRSLKASSGGIIQAKKALLNCESKIALADELEISRTTVQKFFAGKPVGRENFHKICQRLKLPWQAIAELTEEHEFSNEKFENDNSFDINALVQEVRQLGHSHIQNRCGIVRVLDMSQPIELCDIYTNVNILEKISGRQRLEVSDLIKICVADEFERPNLGRIIQNRVLGIEAVKKYSKLIVLGKPGSGKTTFLKHIAIQCSSGKVHTNLVPIFIPLKDFAEATQQPSLLEYITDKFETYGITDAKVANQLLSCGKMLVLLDGLDEVKEISSQRVLDSVSNFFTQFSTNHFIISCRIAAREYTFTEFTEVEIADFDQLEIASFAIKWFAAEDPSKSKKFIQKLQVNSSIRELATSPLLLTLLCLVFESAELPPNRSELYEEGVNILLKRWDDTRNIERDQVYKEISVQHKKDLLSQIALTTFEQGDYFFRQQELEQYIADYICNLPSANTDISALQLDSTAVLKSIEQQHGLLVERAHEIYSFSHLTFQEYFAAREIISNSNPQALDTALKQLTSRITDKRWREVILLTIGMSRNADYVLLLMKQHIDDLLAQDIQLQEFLTWVNQKFQTAPVCYKPVLIRAFYFDLALARSLGLFGGTLDLARAIDRNFTRGLDPTLALDLALDRALALDQVVNRTQEPNHVFRCVLERVINLSRTFEPKLKHLLQQLKQQLPEFGRDKKKFIQWWQVNGQTWTEELRSVAISKRNIGHNWQFSKQQREALKQYYDANQLLVDCLNSNYYVTRTVRSEIENTLLLPTKVSHF